MTVNIFHYHLNPGGVTRIIESQIRALKRLDTPLEIRLFCGGCENKDQFMELGVEPVVFEPLNYIFPPAGKKSELYKLFEEIKDFVTSYTAKNDIFHVHNLNLGKNPVFTAVISSLIKSGYKVVNHAHDFAEDREWNMGFLKEVIRDGMGLDLKETMYPDERNYLFATLNDFDLKRLDEFSVDEERRFILPNPVIFDNEKPLPEKKESREEIIKTLSLDPSKIIVTYPVRVIERKNIGEFLLLAVLFSERASWMVTLPPQNPLEIKKYEKWLEFVDDENIEVYFEVGKKLDFMHVLRGSGFCISTSYREGFGMVYLEPWLMGTPVTGRDIPYLTSDFRREGLIFDNLYTEISIPGSGADFSDLPVDVQKEAIRKANDSEDFREKIREINPALDGLLKDVPEKVINENIEIIRKKYSLEKYGERLIGIYKAFS